MNTNLINTMAQLFSLPDGPTYKNIYIHLKNLINEIDEKDARDEDILVNLAAMRVVGPVFELYHMIEVEETYANGDKLKMECEIINALNEFAKRGIFNDTHISKQLLEDAGIRMSDFMWNLV